MDIMRYIILALRRSILTQNIIRILMWKHAQSSLSYIGKNILHVLDLVPNHATVPIPERTFFLCYTYLVQNTQKDTTRLCYSTVYRFNAACTTCLHINTYKNSSNTSSSFCWNKTPTIALYESMHNILFIHTQN